MVNLNTNIFLMNHFVDQAAQKIATRSKLKKKLEQNRKNACRKMNRNDLKHETVHLRIKLQSILISILFYVSWRGIRKKTG